MLLTITPRYITYTQHGGGWTELLDGALLQQVVGNANRQFFVPNALLRVLQQNVLERYGCFEIQQEGFRHNETVLDV